ncbi:MAG: ABC transporter substrate-binding protein [Lewinella sp.]|nr:ABC transporter substrate-binding protein [Lewinella sp.]
MPVFTDQMGRRIPIPERPERIVSLVPSQTELLADLGLDDEVAGITKFCIHPERWFRSKRRIGGTKQLHLDRIAELDPDLIIGNKEENDREQIEALMGKYPVWMSDIRRLPDALNMIRSIGAITGREAEALDLAGRIGEAFARLDFPEFNRMKVAYLIWRSPFMAAAADTFIDEMLRLAGFDNAFKNRMRYPEISGTDLQDAAPDAVFLSSEPYPFREKHFEEIRDHCPGASLLLVDGEYFSWYGSRLLGAPAYFNGIRKKLER